ncbi:MAG: histidine kinase [Bacteroidales bacterium]|nr:histidine kinase [Bacteroidales bacterium]MDZ4203256.1 histidine kinase [Bacteroidales bacterium]
MLGRFFKNRLSILYLVLWITIAVIHFYLVAVAWNIDLTLAALDSLIFNSIFAILGLGLWFWTKYSDLRKKNALELLFNHLTGCTISVFIWLAASYQLMNVFVSENLFYKEFLDSSLMLRGISGVFFYMILTAVFYLFTGYRELYEKTKREGQLTTMLREAELNMLRSQIKPHFLFNSLNSINSLIISKPDLAQEMVIKLSEFMRYSLSHQDESMITFEKELYHMGLYLEIEKVRFKDRLVIEKEICDACLHQRLPAMILQPLLENAVKYGVYETIGNVEVGIRAQIAHNHLKINVSNGFDPENYPRKGTGTGLKNISKRLQTIYGRFDLMNIRKENNIFEVELIIPLT